MVRERGVLFELLQGRERVDVALQAARVVVEEHVAPDNVVVRPVGDIRPVLHRRAGKQVILEEHRVAVDAVHPPLPVVMGEVTDEGDMVGELRRAQEVTVDEDARVRALRGRADLVAAGEVEALDDHVVRAAQVDHPVAVGARGAVYHHLSLGAERLEVDVAPVAGVGLVAEREA